MSADPGEIEQLIGCEIKDSQVKVQGLDGKYQVMVVSDFFDGLNAVKRQQTVYHILNSHIASGDIHAVSMQLLTTEEFAEL